MAYKNISLLITLFYFLFNNPRCSEASDTLHQGQQLKDWDGLISSNYVFTLKFFSFGSMVSPYLGIFYTNNEMRSHQSDYYQRKAADEFSITRPVWVANRNNPISDIYGRLIIDDTGKLTILSGGGIIMDLFSPSQLVKRKASVTLLDSGNLVLQELHPNGSVKHVLWQSFDYPTDTLLPGMKLGINHKTGQKWSLTAWRNKELPAEGLFKLEIDPNGTGQMIILRQGNVHWSSGPWQQNGEFNNTDLQSSGPDVRLYYVSNETEQSFTFLTRTYYSYPALRMNQDGWLQGSLLALDLRCHSIDNPPGCAEEEFEKVECRKDYKRLSQRVDLYNHFSFVNEHVFDESYNLYDCQRICWTNCSCVAYTTTRNRIGCKTYGKMIYNQGRYRPQTTDYYIFEKKIGKKKKNQAWIALIVMIVPFLVFLSCYWAYNNFDFREIAKKIKKLSLLQMRRMRHFYIYLRTDKNLNTELRYFTFQSISSATNKFSSANKLGKGGFGEVYKAKLVDGQEVAVKRLSGTSGQGVEEFKNETELIAKLQHTNLVRLLGCCVEKQEKILVYEYVPNSSLDLFLFDPSKKGLLDWNNRFVIVDGIAQGILYLHKFSRLRIIHRDLKEVMTCIHVGLLCVQDHAMDRPTMSEVVSMLTNENMYLLVPKQPAFYIERHETKTQIETESKDKLDNGSEIGESISILVSK